MESGTWWGRGKEHGGRGERWIGRGMTGGLKERRNEKEKALDYQGHEDT